MKIFAAIASAIITMGAMYGAYYYMHHTEEVNDRLYDIAFNLLDGPEVPGYGDALSMANYYQN